MTTLLVIVGVVLAAGALAAVGHLSRIADAIEAQNRAYGIGDEPEKAHTEEPA